MTNHQSVTTLTPTLISFDCSSSKPEFAGDILKLLLTNALSIPDVPFCKFTYNQILLSIKKFLKVHL